MTPDPGVLQVGHVDSQKPVAIRLSGETILEEHCYFDNQDGTVMLYALPDSVTVRGTPSILEQDKTSRTVDSQWQANLPRTRSQTPVGFPNHSRGSSRFPVQQS